MPAKTEAIEENDVADTPPHGLELLEWVKVIGATIVTAIGSVWGWWRGTKHAIYARIDEAESNMITSIDSLRHAQNGHHTKIAVLETQQVNNNQRLESIHADTKAIREQLSELTVTILNRK